MQYESFIAHRGANTYAPENTLEAFQRAKDSGVNWQELDVQLTRDGEVVVFHDHYMERVTGIKSYITEMASQEIKNLSPLNLFPLHYAHCQIPFFEDYLDWMVQNPQIQTNIEIKPKPYQDIAYERQLAETVLNKLKLYPSLRHRILLSSFSLTVLESLFESNSTYKMAMLVSVADFESWDHFTAQFESYYYPQFQKWQLSALVIDSAFLNQKRLAYLKELCGIVLAYSRSFFNQSDIQQLLQWGVDGVFIDEMAHADSKIGRKRHKAPVVGFLATGDEIVTGDITNTNTPYMAIQLFAQGFQIGMHLHCNDQKRQLEHSLNYLLDAHDIVITVGGLGPTQDDMTMRAVAQVTGERLVYSDESWARLHKRLALSFHSNSISEVNHRQCYFPENAAILPNEKGTADGCLVQVRKANKTIIVLPGPPSECQYMFDHHVWPFLKLRSLASRKIYRWLVIGYSEAAVAEHVDPLANQYNQFIGYRAAYPYIELKLEALASNKQMTEDLANEITRLFSGHIVSSEGVPAWQQLLSMIEAQQVLVKVRKDVTKGWLNGHYIPRGTDFNFTYQVEITTHGLQNYWQDVTASHDNLGLELSISKDDTHLLHCYVETALRIKGRRTLNYVLEWVSWQIVQMIEKEKRDDES